MTKFATILVVLIALSAFVMANNAPQSYGSPHEPYGEKKGYDASPYSYNKKNSYGYDSPASVYDGYHKPSYGYQTPYYAKKDYHRAPPYDYNKKDSYSHDAFPVTYYKPTSSYGYSKNESPKYHGSYSSIY